VADNEYVVVMCQWSTCCSCPTV